MPSKRKAKDILTGNQISRRRFLSDSAPVSAGVGLAMTGANCLPDNRSAASESPSGGPKASLAQETLGRAGDGVTLSRPVISGSQLDFRLALARTRTASYPLDSMDFIMMDLERPDGCSRHAHWCTGDLTGRLLEFLSCAEGVDGRSDPRLTDLFERILRQRRPSGLFGRYAGGTGSSTKMAPEDDFRSGADRLFSGLIRYYGLTKDKRALDAAIGVADRILSQKDTWLKHIRSSSGRTIEAWITEPFARLYGITKNQSYLDFVGMINQHLGSCETRCHAHGFMSTLRGLQLAAIITGDKSFNEKPEKNRRIIIEKQYETPDGCTPESFPSSVSNEGCSIADWLMLNLNAGRLTHDAEAYKKAERIFYNALAFNQWINGSFGHRAITGNGYGMTRFEEAWWCCLHDGGMAMAEFARHVVTFHDNTISVNFLVPGKFVLPLADGLEPEVTITTHYPASADATIEVRNLPTGAKVKLRVPTCVGNAKLSETKSPGRVNLTLKGELGHNIEQCHPGVMLTYGPLVMAPSTYTWNSSQRDPAESAVPPGYIPQTLPAGIPSLVLADTTASQGRLQLESAPVPDWSYFEEGPGSRCGVEGAAVNVGVKFSDGTVKQLRFRPLCSNTSNLSLFETPIVFAGIV